MVKWGIIKYRKLGAGQENIGQIWGILSQNAENGMRISQNGAKWGLRLA